MLTPSPPDKALSSGPGGMRSATGAGRTVLQHRRPGLQHHCGYVLTKRLRLLRRRLLPACFRYFWRAPSEPEAGDAQLPGPCPGPYHFYWVLQARNPFYQLQEPLGPLAIGYPQGFLYLPS